MAEKVLKIGVEREDGFLYYIDKDGDVARVQMALPGQERRYLQSQNGQRQII